MQDVIILRGLPASGKTSWAISYCLSNQRHKRISKDDLRAMLDDGYYTPENERLICKARDALVSTILQARYSVVVDDVNINAEHIETMIEIAQAHGAHVRIVDFNTSLEECIDRDAHRERSVGAARIGLLYKQLEAMRRERSFDVPVTVVDPNWADL